MKWTRAVVASMVAGSRSASTSTQFTYTLGHHNKHCLYVPLTSYCNSATLPQSRGPNFIMPPDVVASLCRLRDAEHSTEKWKQWCHWLDFQEAPQKLPVPSETSYVSSIPVVDHDVIGADHRPTVDELVTEIEAHLRKKESDDTNWTIVVTGEGEPTLRLDALLQLVARLRDDVIPRCACTGTSLRITTNGLLDSANTRRLLEACCTGGPGNLLPVSFSVALMTHDADHYDQWMQPLLPPPQQHVVVDDNADVCAMRPHDRVQSFVRSAVAAGLAVEATAVDRPGVDRLQTNQLAATLGVSAPVRWRPYFP